MPTVQSLFRRDEFVEIGGQTLVLIEKTNSKLFHNVFEISIVDVGTFIVNSIKGNIAHIILVEDILKLDILIEILVMLEMKQIILGMMCFDPIEFNNWMLKEKKTIFESFNFIQVIDDIIPTPITKFFTSVIVNNLEFFPAAEIFETSDSSNLRQFLSKNPIFEIEKLDFRYDKMSLEMPKSTKEAFNQFLYYLEYLKRNKFVLRL